MSGRCVPCMWMRGGTSKGGYFLKHDLPPDRDAFLLKVMGSPDPRQIDGMGGADLLTSKVAVVSPSQRPGVDVDYLFLQIGVDSPSVFDGQNCGNILAGVGPFAIERGLVAPRAETTSVAIHMENTGRLAIARVATPGGRVCYGGEAQIDGVPGTASPVLLEFKGLEGATCGALLPTGNVVDEADQLRVTMIDNGMPVVVVRAHDMGIEGTETPAGLDSNAALKERLERLRLACGPAMNLGDVAGKTVPKMTMVSAPRAGGAVSTRTFIPHRCHAGIGVFGAISVASACLFPASPAADVAHLPAGREKAIRVEHPGGETTVIARIDAGGALVSCAILRTARKLFDGQVFA